MTGVTAGVGLLAAYRWTGPLMFVVALAVLELAIAPVAWSVLTELGRSAGGVVTRVSPPAALGALALIGLTDAMGGWAFLVAAGALVTSPLVGGWTRGGLRPALERMSPRTETRRRFDDIVAGFGTPGEELPPR